MSALRVVQPPAQDPNEHWSMGFMTDSLYTGQRFQVLTIVDNMSRESLASTVDISLPSRRVIVVLDRLAMTSGLPKVIYLITDRKSWPKRRTTGHIAMIKTGVHSARETDG